ncbi:hypothetical protein OU426_01540 [Frigidibacter sp. RF13]|uniref:hypothetical protein n=1 Tax=Frigidibacter sp. RF13 TaxID=2997340 RepID=UPI00226EF959|nr:hypothetical protein [Frigidibacter sp. RF13]MCY1125523.1 hypothetical protein [Frigidibacter sp. RF13]
MSDRCAVLTGDIVRSSAAGPEATDRAMAVLSAAARDVAGWTGGDTRFTRYRGDGWQIYLQDRPGLAFRATLFLAARLTATLPGMATRISVGIGPVARLGATGLSGASGAAFETSGQALDALSSGWHRLAIAGEGVLGLHAALFEVADWMIRRWSREQAEAVALALEHDGAPMAELAGRLDITRQAFEARIAASGFRALATALHEMDRETFGGAA